MSHRINKKAVVTGTAALVAIATGCVFSSTAAVADPLSTNGNSGTANRAFVATGSDTIQSLFDGLAYGYTKGSTTVTATTTNLDSYDAFGSSTVPGRIVGTVQGPSYTRPGGSGAGRQALSASWDPANDIYSGTNMQKAADGTTSQHAVDIARSSGQPSSSNLVAGGSTNDDLTSVQIARDAVTIAVGSGLKSTVTAVTTTQIDDLYAGVNDPSNGVVVPSTGDPSLNGTTVHVELPQSNSGTRQFFLTALFGTQTPTLASYVDTTSKLTTGAAANTLNENNAGEVVSDGLIPFSAAQFIAQDTAVATNTGVSSLGLPSVDARTAVSFSRTGVPSANTNTSTSLYGDPSVAIPAQTTTPSGNAILSRDVYAVVPTAQLASNSALKTLVETTIPGATSVIKDFGFLPVTFNTATSNSYLHSKWEH